MCAGCRSVLSGAVSCLAVVRGRIASGSSCVISALCRILRACSRLIRARIFRIFCTRIFRILCVRVLRIFAAGFHQAVICRLQCLVRLIYLRLVLLRQSRVRKDRICRCQGRAEYAYALFRVSRQIQPGYLIHQIPDPGV